ncbi:MAG: 3'(2'),5'-bisphosphate nucleotidase CysQ [Chlorobiaceae bacterium]|nr:3'(2'),5'-bisphosphate nucleotidase CysQ [Chlorobiaceae bacterium]
MTPELIIAIEVCLKAGKFLHGRGSSYLEARGEGNGSPKELFCGIEAFRQIVQSLSVTGLPVIGPYSEPVPFQVRAGWRRFWLVSPVYGEASVELTVAVALIEGHEPVLGVVYAPVTDELYCACRDSGAYRVRCASNSFAEAVKLFRHPATRSGQASGPVRLLVGGRRPDERLLACIEDLRREYPDIHLVQRGDGMSFCLVAAGEADLFPRLEATCEWETAAGHAILKAAGRNLFDLSSGCELTYNKPEMVNPRCIAR